MASRRIKRGPFGKKNATILSALYHLNVGERTALLKNANPHLVNQICECALNLLEGNIPLSGGQKKRLRKHARVLRKLAGPTTAKRKKAILVQSGGSLLPALLAPLLGTLITSLTGNA